MAKTKKIETFEPGSFEPNKHFYPKVLNAQMHPFVRYFLGMSKAQIIERYCHLNPLTKPHFVEEILSFQPQFFRWAGADLFHTTTHEGNRKIVVIETNSCPSGLKSMPIVADDAEMGSYQIHLERAFLPLLDKRLPEGHLAVLYDKNYTEASGYAATLAELTQEKVFLVPFFEHQYEQFARFSDGILEICIEENQWIPIRAALRYVTQRPWNRIPVQTKTKILNPIIACLAGGRNKLTAAKAYDFYNAELREKGLNIRTPETHCDISKEEIPLWIARFGGHAVIKDPYSNAGQGVFTIVNPEELQAFMNLEHRYDRFIVQSLIGNYSWSSEINRQRYYHTGTLPDRRGKIYVVDLRLMIVASPQGYVPIAVYARRAKDPLCATLDSNQDSWEMLGTNLSKKDSEGEWTSETERLLLMDERDFNKLGLGMDDLIEAYVQTVLSTIAIDRMATSLISQKGNLKTRLFRSLNTDPGLLKEINDGSNQITGDST